jgi:hypothetical protein
VEGRRDPDAAPPACGGSARAASRSFEVNVGGQGVAGPARRDAAARAPGRVAADRHSRHDFAVAPRHRPRSVGAVVPPGTPAAGAPQCAVGGAEDGPGEPVMGVPALCRTRYNRRIHGELAGLGAKIARRPCGKSRTMPGPAPRRDEQTLPGRSSCAPRPRRSWLDRARHQAHPHPQSHPAPDRGLDRTASPKPDHEPRRAGAQVKFMIRDRGPDYTAAFDAVLADAGIRTVLCNVRTPHERDRRTLDRGMPARASRPYPHLE